MSYPRTEAAYNYFITRQAWAQRRLLGDILPHHPVYGPMPTTSDWVSWLIKRTYLPAIEKSFNTSSIMWDLLQNG